MVKAETPGQPTLTVSRGASSWPPMSIGTNRKQTSPNATTATLATPTATGLSSSLCMSVFRPCNDRVEDGNGDQDQ